MSGEERRNQIIQLLKLSKTPVCGTELSQKCKVSRQVIVQDIAIIRANGHEIMATNRGYVLSQEEEMQRVFKVKHEDSQIEKELVDIVDLGGTVKDVFVYHKVYGVVKAELNLKSRRDVANYMQKIHEGTSSPLKNVTAGYHYHTVLADGEETLDLIQEKLKENGFLAKLQDYEPVDFWNEKK